MFHSTLKDIFLSTNEKSYNKAKAVKYAQKICKMMKENLNDMKITTTILSEYASTDEEDQKINPVCIMDKIDKEFKKEFEDPEENEEIEEISESEFNRLIGYSLSDDSMDEKDGKMDELMSKRPPPKPIGYDS